jgi:hypothetical protein
MHQFRIETGERRYWATWLLHEFISDYNSDGMIPCIIISADRSSIFRQAKENIARSGLSAIAMAHQAALLLLTVYGEEIPYYAVPNDFYRQALEHDLRGKREYTESILSAMGGMKKGYFSYIKNLLRLSNEAMELADRHNLDARRLCPVVALEPECHAEVVRQIIDLNLTAKQVKELCEDDLHEGEEAEQDEIPAPALKIAKAAQTTKAAAPQDIARALIKQEGDTNLARVRLQALRKLLTDAERFLVDE